ncbi:MAG: hypothetical protein WB626_05260 [Bacteroidota bacterium]
MPPAGNSREGAFRVRLAALVIPLLMPGAVSFLPLRARTADPAWRATVSLRGAYDDNILRFSDLYLDLFRKGSDPGRFHIRTGDDVVLQSAAQLSVRFEALPRLPTTVSGGIRLRTGLRNPIKNFTALSLRVRQAAGSGTWASLAYSLIPSFYVRHYRIDEDLPQGESYQPFTYGKERVSLELRRQVAAGTVVSLELALARSLHNGYFTAYDTREREGSIDLSRRLHSRFLAAASFRYTDARAEGRVSGGGMDPSYREIRWGLACVWDLPPIRTLRHSLQVEAAYLRRAYGSRLPVEADPLHAGRLDHAADADLGYRLELGAGWAVTADYGWFLRDAGSVSPVNERLLSEERDYVQNAVGLGCSYVLEW